MIDRTVLVALVMSAMVSGCLGGDEAGRNPSSMTGADVPETGHGPHVVVGIGDNGINPYHELLRRPNLTSHPCTYLQDFPCDMPALNLTFDLPHDQAIEADRDVWESVQQGTWYWIPGTVFVAVACGPQMFEPGFLLYQDYGLCIVDDRTPTTSLSGDHGARVAGAVIMDEPRALIAFFDGGPQVQPFVDGGITVDIMSISWGYEVPIPYCPADVFPVQFYPLYVKGAGNDPRPVPTDCWSRDHRVIAVGGGYAADKTQEANAANNVDLVSYFVRPTVASGQNEGFETSSGTSFSAPTVAAALAKTIYEVRLASGYGGLRQGTVLDAASGLTIAELRDAMNRTASYDPEAWYGSTRDTGIPVNEDAPWVQWGWGFFDANVANATVAHLLGTEQPPKPLEAIQHMEAIWTARTVPSGL